MPCNTQFSEHLHYHGKGRGDILQDPVLCYCEEAYILSCFFSTIHFMLGERIIDLEELLLPPRFSFGLRIVPQMAANLQSLCFGGTRVTQKVEAKVIVTLKLMTVIYPMPHMCYRHPFTISDLYGNVLSWVTFRNEELGASGKHMLYSRSYNIVLGFLESKLIVHQLYHVLSLAPSNPTIP